MSSIIKAQEVLVAKLQKLAIEDPCSDTVNSLSTAISNLVQLKQPF